MRFTKRQARHPWCLPNRTFVFDAHGPARQHDLQCHARRLRNLRQLRGPFQQQHSPGCDIPGREANNKRRGLRSKVRVNAQTLWVGVKGIATDIVKARTAVGAYYPQSQCSFFSRLPTELRLRIYKEVLATYSNTIHILAGKENGDLSRNVFHTPCITPPELEVPGWKIFHQSRWSSGPWGSYHFYCDLYSSKPSIFHEEVLENQDKARAVGELRPAYEVVCEAKQKLQKQAPFLQLLLSCRRMHNESISIIFSSLTMSFIGALSLFSFTERINSSLIQRLQSIHIVWPSWWKPHVSGQYINRTEPSWVCNYWMPPEPDASIAEGEWKALWQSFSPIGFVKHLHITIFQVCNEWDGSNIFQIEELLLALQDIRANKFLVEAWGEEERVEEPSADRPFRLHLNPALIGPTNRHRING